MILAVGIAAIVLVAINAVLFSALHLREVTQEAVDDATPLDQALTILRRDLQCAVPPEPNGVLTGDFKAGNVTSLGLSLPVAVEMFTATGVLHDNEPWGDIQRVTYELKDSADPTAPGKDLVRSVSRNLLSTAALDVQDQWLMGGVENIRFSCFDGMQWYDAWDTTDMTSASTNLPVAVRVLIQWRETMAGTRARRRWKSWCRLIRNRARTLEMKLPHSTWPANGSLSGLGWRPQRVARLGADSRALDFHRAGRHRALFREFHDL